MLGTIKIGRVFGFEIRIHWSWFFVFALVTTTFATSLLKDFYPNWTDGQRWVVGAFIAIVFFLSILLHEMSHSVLARHFGIAVSSITLFIFGGVSNLTREPDNARQEFLIAIVGPVTSIVIAIVLGLAYVALRPIERGAAGVAANLAVINAAIGFFNLVPGFPLDGGRVLRSVFWYQDRNILDATRLASKVGQFVAYLIMGFGVLSVLLGDLFTGIWFLLIGNFLRSASVSSYEQLFLDTVLKGIPATTVASQDFRAVSPDLMLSELVDGLVLEGHGRCFPVVAGEELLGLVTITDLRQTPREEWPKTTVYRAMTPFARLSTVGPKDDLPKVLAQMATADVNQIPLVDGKLLRGIIYRSDVIRYIQVRQQIGTGAVTH